MRFSAILTCIVGVTIAACASGGDGPADLILHNAKVWTVSERQPVTEAVAVRGNRIMRVGSDAEILSLAGPATQVIDLEGKLMLPGFNDGHTHFENATEWFYQAILFDVNTEDELIERLAQAVERVPSGMWIYGGEWGALAAWRAASTGGSVSSFAPSQRALDAVAPDHPVILKRHDGLHIANSAAFERARITRSTQDPLGGRFHRDPATGELTGVMDGMAADRLVRLMAPRSRASQVIAARAQVELLNRHGITSIHDIARVDSVSQRHIFHTHVERSFSDLEIFLELRRRGELTVRVYPQLTLDLWADYVAHGVVPNGGDELIRYGGLKSFVDGYLMREPLANAPEVRGNFTFRYLDVPTMRENILGADRAGFSPGIHVIGDSAIALVIDAYEAAMHSNPARDRRFRLVHAWFPSAADIERAGRLRLIADVTPVHIFRDFRAVEESLGPERVATAHPWRQMWDSGMIVNIVSDWPGSYYQTDFSPIDPLENIYYAVTRRTRDGRPEGGWLPDNALTMEEAIRAYTYNPAYSSYEDHIKGSIEEGKLADLVVLSKDILSLDPAEILTTDVVYTIFDGTIVFASPEHTTVATGDD